MRLLVLFLVLLGLAPLARAQDATPVTDPAQVQQRYRAIATQPEYQENEETLVDVHWSDVFSQWFRHLVMSFQDFKYAGQLSGTARLVVLILAILTILVLIGILRRLVRRRYRPASEEKPELVPDRALLTPRQYEKQLRDAIAARDWHQAWLAAWLQFLASLENRHLVMPDRSRTNREYLLQLRGQDLPASAGPLLARLVDDYDRTIYGQQTIDETRWTSFRAGLDELSLQLNLRAQAAEGPA